jgi:hypothetical protein
MRFQEEGPGVGTPEALETATRSSVSQTLPTPGWLQIQRELGESPPATEDEAFDNLLDVFDATFLPFEGGGVT